MKTRRVTMSTQEALERLRKMNRSDLRRANPALRSFYRRVVENDDAAILRRLGQLDTLVPQVRMMRTELAPAARQPMPADLTAALSAAPADLMAAATVEIPDAEIPWNTAGGFMLLDTPTGDGRTFAASGFRQRPPGVSVRETPFPLMANLETTWGHDGARIVGRVDTMDATGSATAPPQATGIVDATEDGTEDEVGRLVAHHLAQGNLRGISADLGIYESEMTFIEDDEGFIESMEFVATMFDVMGITITPFPGFAACALALDLAGVAEPVVEDPPADDEGDDLEASGRPEIRFIRPPAPADLRAAGGPIAPPRSAFDDPQFDRLTPITVSDDGTRIYGHLAPWPTGGEDHTGCHIGYSDVCVCAEPSQVGYAYFLTGDMLCDDGSRLPVGTLTLRGGHGGGLTIEEINRHYDDTDSAVAYLNVGDDQFGTWCSGVVRAGISEEDLQALRCSSVSVHEREIGGSLELVRVCCVNTPGLPVLRASGGVLPDLPNPTAIVDPAGRVVELLASAGARRLAVMKASAMRPPTRDEYDDLAGRVAGLEESLASATRALDVLDPTIRAAALARLT